MSSTKTGSVQPETGSASASSNTAHTKASKVAYLAANGGGPPTATSNQCGPSSSSPTSSSSSSSPPSSSSSSSSSSSFSSSSSSSFSSMSPQNSDSSGGGNSSSGGASSTNSTGNNVTAFLSKLWRLVNDLSSNDLIRWSQSGCSFVILNQIQFAKDLLPLYFKHSNMASFIRQLNMYGFRKIPLMGGGNASHLGPLTDQRTDIAQFYHVNFRRAQEQRLACIKRMNNSCKTHNLIVNGSFCDEVRSILSDVKSIRDGQNSSESILGAIQVDNKSLWRDVAILKSQHHKQRRVVEKLIQFLLSLIENQNNMQHVTKKRKVRLMINGAASETGGLGLGSAADAVGLGHAVASSDVAQPSQTQFENGNEPNHSMLMINCRRGSTASSTGEAAPFEGSSMTQPIDGRPISGLSMQATSPDLELRPRQVRASSLIAQQLNGCGAAPAPPPPLVNLKEPPMHPPDTRNIHMDSLGTNVSSSGVGAAIATSSSQAALNAANLENMGVADSGSGGGGRSLHGGAPSGLANDSTGYQHQLTHQFGLAAQPTNNGSSSASVNRLLCHNVVGQWTANSIYNTMTADCGSYTSYSELFNSYSMG